jgi:CRP/FNR family transcriptional regulator
MEVGCVIPEKSCIGCELKSKLFCRLSDDELQRVSNSKITVTFRKGETIRKQGTFMSHVLSLNSGLAKLYLEGIGQRNAILRIVKPTNFIGGPGIYLDQRHHFTVAALIDTIVCFIEIKALKEIIDTNKTFAHEFMQDFSLNTLSVYTRLISLTQKQMHGRMADTLLYLSTEIFENDNFPMVLSRQDLSDLSAMSKESAVKILREFQRDGILTMDDTSLNILKPEDLLRISRTG